MANIYDTAHQLAKEIKESNEYVELQKAYNELKADEEAYTDFNKLRETQMYLQKCQMEGRLDEIKPAELEEMQELGKKVQEYGAVLNLMEKERALSVMMEEISQIFYKPVTDLYNS